MAQNQNKALNPIRMDSRKFLGALNDSAQAKIAFFESKVRDLGSAVNKQWRLAALYSKDLYIEDVNSGQFYIANHSKNQGSVSINNIQPIQIVESEKADLFEESCLRLVEAIEKNDQRGMQQAFGRMKAQRFTSRIIPESGMVRCKDNVLRRIDVKTPEQINESLKSRIVKAVVESMDNKVVLEEGHVVGGNFLDGERLNLPVSKWATKKLNAKHMRSVAMEAYKSTGFQNRVYDIATLVTEGKIEEAVQISAPFLNEFEEFTLLNRKQTKDLVSNSLAAKAVFNPQLCEDVATLLYKTNLKVNKKKIVSEWKNIASVTENYNLAQNVSILEESRDFESTYNKFLALIFETIGNREIAAEALAGTLSKLKDKTPQIKESHDLSAKLDDLIKRLTSKSVDDATIYEAEDLIATIQEELTANENLSDFDQVPGGSLDADLETDIDEVGKAAGSGQPVININSPLIQIGGSSSAGGAEAAGDLGGEDLGAGLDAEGGDDDLAALLNEPPAAPAAPGGAPAAPAAPGGAPAAPAAPGAAPAAPPRLESIGRNGKAINEEIHHEMAKRGKDTDHKSTKIKSIKLSEIEIEESKDAYSYDSKAGSNSLMGLYGKSIIEDENKVDTIVKMVHRVALANKLDEARLIKHLPKIVESCIRKVILNINESALPLAINQIVDAIASQQTVSEKLYRGGYRSRGISRAGFTQKPKGIGTGKGGGHDSDGDGEGHGKQWKKPWLKDEDKTHGEEDDIVKNESLRWLSQRGDVLYGVYGGVKFAMDHGNNELPPVILSEDGTVEIPIPTKVHSSALAAAKVSKGNPALFKEWLSNNILQLAPITEEEKMEIEEARDEEMDAMKPVESTEPSADLSSPSEEESVPDFSEGDDMSIESDGGDEEVDLDLDLEASDDVEGVDLGNVDVDLGGEGDIDIDVEEPMGDDEMDMGSDSALKAEVDELRADVEEIKDEIGLDDSEDEMGSEDGDLDLEMSASASDVEDMESEDAGIDADSIDSGSDEQDFESSGSEEPMDDTDGVDESTEDEEEEDVEEADEEYEDEGEEDEGFEGIAEDNDITDPSRSKYHKQAEEDPRTDVKHKLHPRKDDESVEGIGDRDDVDDLDI